MAAPSEFLRVCQRKRVQAFRTFLADSFEQVVYMNQIRDGGKRRASTHSSTEALADSIKIVHGLEMLESMQASFVVVGAGDDDLNGEWSKLGSGLYGRTVDRSASAKWNSQTQEWQMFYDEEVKYRLPFDGSESEKGPPEEIPPLSDRWKIVEGNGPAPVTKALEMHQKRRLVLFEVFAWSWRHNPPSFEELSAEEQLKTGEETHSLEWTNTGDLENTVHWRDLRGPYGESIVSWLWILRSQDSTHEKLQRFYEALTEWILHFEPELAGVRFMSQPFVGQTVLHQACAASDVELVSFIMNEPRIQQQPFFQDGLLEARLTGSFIDHTRKVPAVLQDCLSAAIPDDDLDSKGPTPLDVACIAPEDDEKCCTILKLLLNAGASPIFYHNSGQVSYNLLHVVAASSWHKGQKESPLMSTSRMTMIIKLFMSHQSEYFEKWGCDMRSQPNSANLTPLQVSAMFGNVDAFCDMLDNMKVLVWQWGGKKEVGFPLTELDSGADDEHICALELMTVYRHYNLLSLNLMAGVVSNKWETFGKLWLCRMMVNQLACWCCTALICLDDTAGYSSVRFGARVCLFTLASSYIGVLALLFLLCARKEEWFRHMDFCVFRTAGNRINFWQLIAVRNASELLFMVLLALLPPWYEGDHVRHSRFYTPVWHTIASVWFLSGISFFCSYLEMFKSTSALALAIPEVAQRDLIPFFVLFAGIYLSCAVALRIVSAISASPTDQSFGSFWEVLKTLEEATHGPDVKWRAAMEQQPQPAGAIFVTFLWLTLLMLSLLIAVFCNTFDALKSKVNERLMFRRAMFCLTIEKIFPIWYHQHRSWGRNGCNVGSKLGITPAECKNDSANDFFTREESAGLLGILGKSVPSYGSTGLHTPRSSKPAHFTVEDLDRWWLWSQSRSTFEMWRKPLDENGWGEQV